MYYPSEPRCTNVSLVSGTDTFTAVALDNLRTDTNTTTAYLPSSVSLAYDGNGNLTTNGTRVLEYDDANQLIRITEASAWKSEFTYDGKMRRRIRKEYTWQSSNWVLSAEARYVYDDKLVIQERDGLNTPSVVHTRGRDLSGGLEGAGGIGGLLARTESWKLNSENPASAHAYYQADGNGNVTTLVDTSQTVVGRYLFDPFGNTLAASGPLAEANLYRFSSKEFHVASGLIYYLYRSYDPNLQRWPIRSLRASNRAQKTILSPRIGCIFSETHSNSVHGQATPRQTGVHHAKRVYGSPFN